MKTCITLLATLFLCGMTAFAQQQTDLDSADLHGPVQSVRLLQNETDSALVAWQDIPLVLQYYRVFNQQGQIIESHEFRSGHPSGKEYWIYDSAGRNTRSVQYWDNGNVYSVREKHYNDRGDVIEELKYDRDPLQPRSSQTTFYDAAGRVETAITWFDFNYYESCTEWHFRYDEQHNLVEWWYYEDDDSLTMKWIRTNDTITSPDNSEMWVRRNEVAYDADDKFAGRELSLFDSHGTLRSSQRFTPKTDHPVVTTEYNTKGLTIHTLTMLYGRERENWLAIDIIYDNNDNPVAYHRSYYADYPTPDTTPLRQDTTFIAIDYDQHGNWIRKRYTERTRERGAAVDVPYMIEVREITYFTE